MEILLRTRRIVPLNFRYTLGILNDLLRDSTSCLSREEEEEEEESSNSKRTIRVDLEPRSINQHFFDIFLWNFFFSSLELIKQKNIGEY